MVIMTAIAKERIVIATAEDTDTVRVGDPKSYHLSVLLWRFWDCWFFRLLDF